MNNNTYNTPTPLTIPDDPMVSPLYEAMFPFQKNEISNSMNNLSDPFLMGSVTQPPIVNQQSSYDPYDQPRSSTFATLDEPISPRPPGYFTSLLCSDQTLGDNELGFGSMSPLPTFETPILDDHAPNNVKYPLLPVTTIPTQNMNRFTETVPLVPRFRSSAPATTFSPPRNTVPNSGYVSFNRYLNRNPTRIYHVSGSAGRGRSPYSFLRPPTMTMKLERFYLCESCKVTFRTAQALGGHMSYHSKAKREKERNEPSTSRCSNPRRAREVHDSLDGGKDSDFRSAYMSNTIVLAEETTYSEKDVKITGVEKVGAA